MKRAGMTTTAVLAALALAACASSPGEETPETGVPAPSETPEQTTTPAAELVRATLNATAGSNVSGTVMIEHVGEAVQVRLEVTGLQEGTNYTGHLHRGTCSEDRGEVTSIESFTVMGDRGEASTSVERASLDPAEQQYFIEIHGGADAVVACGNLPAGAMSH